MSPYVEVLVSILSLAATVGIFFAIMIALRYLKEKINNKYLNDAIDIVETVVDQVNQTYVKSLKESGEFTIEAQKKALQDAMATAESLMSEKAIKYIEDNFGDLEVWLVNQIESYIFRTKQYVISEEVINDYFDGDTDSADTENTDTGVNINI